jgi:DNA invertase Pin-like site-specific DNA recombinase
MRPKVYSYTRFSDAKQAGGASTERQRAYAQTWADQNGLQLDHELSMLDEGLSAYHQKHIKRGALGVFLKAVEDGLVAPGSVLVVEGLDRLSRAEPIQAQAQLASIINAGISVVTASDGKVYSRERLKDNPMDLVYSLLVMIRAHEESDTKSKRVRDAIRRQCKGWIDGTYRGLVRLGQTPGWLRVVDGKWELIPERAEALRLAIELYRQGTGLGPIARELTERGLSYSSIPTASGPLLRVLMHPATKGEKHVELDGETYVLEGYYPAVIDPKEWDALQELTGQRSRKFVRAQVPAILTGFGATVCGYCGSPKKSQTMTNRTRADGVLTDGLRRLQCTRINSGVPCPVKGSCSAAPIERALMNYCSDLVNLQALYSGDRAAAPRAELAAAKAKLTKISAQLDRITEALLESESGTAPTTFMRRARQLEDEQAQAEQAVRAAERALAEAARTDIDGADDRWRSLAAGVEALDPDARKQARQLIADTFERIVVYRAGMRPLETPKGQVDVLLCAKGGRARLLRIDAKGNWVAGEDLSEELLAA